MKEEEKKLQEKYIEMKVIEENLNQLQTQANTIEHQLAELSLVVNSLDEFSKLDVGKKVLVPISSGIFFEAEIKRTDNLFVNIGADTVVAKDIPSTKRLIGKQMDEVKKLQEKILINVQKLSKRYSDVEKELRQIASKLE